MLPYDRGGLKAAAPGMFAVAKAEEDVEAMRKRLLGMAQQMEFETFLNYDEFREGSIIRVRDCARAFRSILAKRSEDLARFSVAQAIRDAAAGHPRPDLTPAFFADLIHILLGLHGEGPGTPPADEDFAEARLEGRAAAEARSRQLDALWHRVDAHLERYEHGLLKEAIAARQRRRQKLMAAFGAGADEWDDWHWQVRHVVQEPDALARLVALSDDEREAVRAAKDHRVPFGITPYYLSLIDETGSRRDQALRAQVIPPLETVKATAVCRECDLSSLDFMREEETSPVDLITRRYPAIVVFKPYATCPQICVYCQRNFEIERVLSPNALARPEEIDRALHWIEAHPTIHEVLVTGGDPLLLEDDQIRDLLARLAAIPAIERIRIGTRAFVTMPMRFTPAFCRMLGSFREPGRREVVVVTHVQHPYEITPDTVAAVERTRAERVPVYNQLVYTFWVSRRFEAAALRRLLRLAGISPYYTFNTKGKEETRAYRVPIARLLQEQKEEARLLPGMARTDEAVYNVPSLGKNYLRAVQHRDIISIMPDGSRVYEFHPWEKNVSGAGPLSTYVSRDVPILEYLRRLEKLGEDVAEYETIWYYF